MKPRHIDTEVARLEALRQYQILDTEPEEAYDNLAQLAAFICGTPISLVNFIDENRQWFKAKIGLDVSEMPRSVGLSYLCQEQRHVVVIPDTLADEKLASNPVVTGYPYIRFYAGVPLITPKGDMVGTLCAIDQVPRQLSQKQVEAFVGLSRLVIDQLELRRHVSEVSKVTEKLVAHEQATRVQSSQLFAEITLKIRDSLQIDEILQTTVTEVQKLLQADRVLIFRLEPDGSGTVVQEAVLPGWPVILGENLFDPCFKEEYIERYRQGRVSALEDIESAHIQPCHREFLQRFAVRANLVVPILVRDDIWGLLLAHQCSAPRQWNQFEMDLLQQLANQIGIALSQAKLLEKETQQSQELTRSNAELEQFAYVASHDLQEPLRMVTSYLQLLERRYKNKLDANADQFIAYAVDGASRMQTLINDLLNYSRVSTRGQPFVPVDCSVVLEQVLANLQVAIADRKAVVTYDTLPQVMADATQLTQVFQNLIANAIKFCEHQQPLIHIGVRKGDADILDGKNLNFTRSEDEWLFSVRDNGIGLESQYTERIFIIFQRLHGRDKYPGTGIGLAICKKIIERHSGRIWVESKPGQGSTFYFTIPDRVGKQW
ncbi:GAF domain-containing sensor histidine kinase [Nostoc sp.]|uniref:GAF domain-containing sensor histidine kinase n=1 Tax=Nostoc sp. TaxID=1180 RepID=UPI002FF935FC